MSKLSGIFGGKKNYPEPSEPATMPDEHDTAAVRAKRDASLRLRGESSTKANQLAPVPGTIGREYSRGTLGG